MLADSQYGFIISSSDVHQAHHFNIDGSEDATVLVFVESREDKRFWGACLPRIDGVRFELKIADEASSTDGKKANGCTRLLSLSQKGDLVLGPNLIFCLDSDERYLSLLCRLGNAGAQGAHIYFTNVYSIENAYLHSVHMDRTFEAVANCSLRDLKFSPSQLIEKISCMVSKTVLLLAFSMESFGYQVVGSAKKSFIESIGKLGSMDMNSSIEESEVFNAFKIAVSSINYELLQLVYDRGLEPLLDKYLAVAAGEAINDNNAYLFVRGHDLFDSVVRVFEAVNKRKQHDEISRVGALYGGAKDAMNSVRNEWSTFASALKYGFYAATPRVQFFENTISRIEQDYTQA